MGTADGERSRRLRIEDFNCPRPGVLRLFVASRKPVEPGEPPPVVAEVSKLKLAPPEEIEIACAGGVGEPI